MFAPTLFCLGVHGLLPDWNARTADVADNDRPRDSLLSHVSVRHRVVVQVSVRNEAGQTHTVIATKTI